MSRSVELLCLANSDKHGNRCIAGLDLENSEWIRPVSDTGDGGLRPREYLTAQPYDPDPLDTIKFHLSEANPEPHQPENWIIGDKRPKFRDDSIGDREARIILDNIHTKSSLFGDEKNRLKYENIVKNPVSSSLELIRPKAPQIRIRERDSKPDQPRAVFELHGSEYDLPITDPQWKDKVQSDVLSEMELEFEPISAYTDEDKQPLFTISLSSPRYGKCYKLVAAIISVPRAVIDYIDDN